MNSKTKFALHENAIAVGYLHQGEFSQALQVLSRALVIAKEGMQDEQHAVMNSTSKSKIPYNIDSFIANEEHHSIFQNNGNDCERQFTYRKTIQLPSNLEQVLLSATSNEHFSCTYDASLIVLSAVIFNFALAHHILGERSHSTAVGRETLSKAAKLYELGYKLQGRQRTRSPVYYMMATLNNMGQVHRLLRQDAHAQQCFSHLLSTFMVVLQHTKVLHDSEAARTCHQLRCLEDGFLRSIFELRRDIAAPAA